MEYERKQIVRIAQIYGQLNSCDTYLINELRKPSEAIEKERAKAVAQKARTFISMYESEVPREIREDLHLDIEELKSLCTQTEALQ